MDRFRRARRKAITERLLDAYTDEEACPPEWVDLLSEIRTRSAALVRTIERETELFTGHEDVRVALDRRARTDTEVRREVEHVNTRIARLNLIAPDARFGRAPLDAEELLRPLYRSPRKVGGAMPSAPAVRGPGTPRNS